MGFICELGISVALIVIANCETACDGSTNEFRTFAVCICRTSCGDILLLHFVLLHCLCMEIHEEFQLG